MTFLRSQLLFDHCSAFESDTGTLTTGFDSSSTELCNVETNTSIALITDSAVDDAYADTVLGAASDMPDDCFAEESYIDISGSCDIHQDNYHDHSSECSGFIISDDDHYVTFDSEHGAADWGCDMSMNSDF